MKRTILALILTMAVATAGLAAWQDEAALTTLADDDEILVKDTSDTTDDATGTVKRSELQYFIDYVEANAAFYEAGDTLQTNSGTSLPGTCTTGELFVDTDADTDGSLYQCVDTDTWKEVDDDGATGAAGGSNTEVQYNNSGALGGISGLTYNGTDTLTLASGHYIDGVAVDMPTLDADELTDDSDPHDLASVELMGTVLTNGDSTGADEWDFPARAEGWNFIFVIEAAQNVTLDPNGTEQWYLNGTQMAEGEAIVNASPTVGESIFCFSTETSVFCESKYSDFTEASP